MPIEAVIFDLGGVVFHYRPEHRLELFAAQLGHSPDWVRRRLIDSGYAMSCDAGRLRGERAHREGIRLVGQRLSLQRFRQLWVSAFVPNDPVIDLARLLKRSAAVSLLTNNSDMVRDGLDAAHLNVMELFRPRLFSCELGILKPDPRIFLAMLALLNVAPEAALLVDDAAQNIAGASALRLNVHHYTGAAGLHEALRSEGLVP